VYYLWKSVERLKSNSIGEFSKKMLPCSPRSKFWKYWWFNFVSLLMINRSVYNYHLCKSVERLKSYSRGEFTKKLLRCSPRLKFWKISKISVCSPCFAEWIGVLLVKIGRTFKKLFKRGIFERNCSLAPLVWKFWWFSFVALVLLNRSVYYAWKSIERFKSYSRGNIFGNSPITPLKRVCKHFDDPSGFH
jgi:hypothetical protein